MCLRMSNAKTNELVAKMKKRGYGYFYKIYSIVISKVDGKWDITLRPLVKNNMCIKGAGPIVSNFPAKKVRIRNRETDNRKSAHLGIHCYCEPKFEEIYSIFWLTRCKGPVYVGQITVPVRGYLKDFIAGGPSICLSDSHQALFQKVELTPNAWKQIRASVNRQIKALKLK